MEPPSSARSGAVTAAAVIAILGSILLLLCAVFGLLGVIMMQNMPGNSGLQQPPELRYAGFVGVAFIAAGGVWGLVSGIGLLRYRNWARISTLVWSGLAVCISGSALLFVSSMKIPMPPNAVAGTEQLARVFIAIIYGLPLVIGVWWLILFTRKPIVALFDTSTIAAGALLDPSGFPAAVAKPRPPLPITIVAWFLIISSAFSTGFLFFQRFPLLLFGHIYHGPAGAIFLVASSVICLVGGIGLLKVKSWGFWLVVSWQAFGLFSGTITLLSPNYDSLMREIIASSPFTRSQAYPMPMENYRAFTILGLVFVAIVLIVLLAYRTRFQAAADSSGSSGAPPPTL